MEQFISKLISAELSVVFHHLRKALEKRHFLHQVINNRVTPAASKIRIQKIFKEFKMELEERLIRKHLSQHCKDRQPGDLKSINCTYEELTFTAKYVLDRIPQRPKIGIICGSGMGALADALKDRTIIPYEEIPNFPVSTVEGHVGQLVFGTLSGVYVVSMQGRFHHYEGYPLWKCAMPIRVMKLIGVEFVLATNAAGGINPAFNAGDVMLIKDHINMMGFAGNNPLQGPNDLRFGPRFPPMNKAYDRELIEEAKCIWRKENFAGRLFEGVYTCLGGPNFETVAELRMLKLLGVDAVGMSTVHEVLTARHSNMTVLAFSLITNECVMDYYDHGEPNHLEVMDVGKLRQDTLRSFVEKIVGHIAEHRLPKLST